MIVNESSVGYESEGFSRIMNVEAVAGGAPFSQQGFQSPCLQSNPVIHNSKDPLVLKTVQNHQCRVINLGLWP